VNRIVGLCTKRLPDSVAVPSTNLSGPSAVTTKKGKERLQLLDDAIKTNTLKTWRNAKDLGKSKSAAASEAVDIEEQIW
jgi:hypothetical protein